MLCLWRFADGSFYPELYRSDWRFKQNYGICASFGDSVAGKVLWRLGKKRKKSSLLLPLALGGLLVGGGLLCLLPFSLWSGKETIWAQVLLAGCAVWVAVFLLLNLINRSICKIVDCLEEMYLK